MPEKASESIEVVKARPFDLTEHVKVVAVAIPLVTAAAVGVLEAAEVKMTEGIWIAILGLVAAVLVGASLVMAADVIARALATGMVARAEGEAKSETEAATGKAAAGTVVAAPPGSTVWLDDEDEPRPMLAIAGDGEKSSTYLVAGRRTTKIPPGNEGLSAIAGHPEWHPADRIRAVKAAKWKP